MVKAAAWVGILVWLLVAAYQVIKPLPTGVGVAAPLRNVPATSITFLADHTFTDPAGQRQVEQHIFSEIFSMIDRAQEFIVLDMFLFNDFQGETPETTRRLALELTEHLLAKRRQQPHMQIVVVSDQVNTVYGGIISPYFDALQQAGVSTVVTNVAPLRDSNPFYSSLWRTYIQWFGNSIEGGGVHHPFTAEGAQVTIRSYLALLNFKANHRKLVVADEITPEGKKLVTLITSANPHDGSSAHSNVALQVKDQLWFDVVQSEQATLNFSGGLALHPPESVEDKNGDVTIQLLTEKAIRDALLRLIDRSQSGDRIDMAMFYLSDRGVVNALLAASRRGAAVRIVLDPNKDAFGRTKNGIPNRTVAQELRKESNEKIEIRWCDTHGEQCHSKLVLVQQGGQYSLLLGSANLTKRNIGNYNLETDVLLQSEQPIQALDDAYQYFEALWTNAHGRTYTTAYETYAHSPLLHSLLYRFQERTGVSSF